MGSFKKWVVFRRGFLIEFEFDFWGEFLLDLEGVFGWIF